MSAKPYNRLKPSLLIVYLFAICQPLFGNEVKPCVRQVDTPQKLCAKGECFDAITFRLEHVPGDGYGDVMNTFGLAEEAAKRWGGTEVYLLIDEEHTYKGLVKRFAKFDPTVSINTINNVKIVKGETPESKAVLKNQRLQITRYPSQPSINELGKAPYNIYLEEPGATYFQALADLGLDRGEALKGISNTRHIRVNPGFGAKTFGVVIPQINPEKTARTELIKRLADKGIKLPENAEQGLWAFVYHHKLHGKKGDDYYKAVAEYVKKAGITKPVYIFDFGATIVESRRYRMVLGGQTINPGPQWKDTNLSIVQVGSVIYETFLEFLKQSDLPPMVSGTQSLFEAIALEMPFYYEIMTWKRPLAMQMAFQAVKTLDHESAKFMVGLLIGTTETIITYDDLREALPDEASTWRLSDVRKKFLVELMEKPERQALMKKFIQSLKNQPDLIEGIESAVTRMVEKK